MYQRRVTRGECVDVAGLVFEIIFIRFGHASRHSRVVAMFERVVQLCEISDLDVFL